MSDDGARDAAGCFLIIIAIVVGPTVLGLVARLVWYMFLRGWNP